MIKIAIERFLFACRWLLVPLYLLLALGLVELLAHTALKAYSVTITGFTLAAACFFAFTRKAAAYAVRAHGSISSGDSMASSGGR